MTIDQPIAIMIAAGITVTGQVIVACINKKASQTSNTNEPGGSVANKRRILPVIGIAASIIAPLAALLILGQSSGGVTSLFVVLTVVFAALFVVSIILSVSVYFVRYYVDRSAENQRKLMLLLQDREHRHDKDMQRRESNIRRTGIASMREIGGG
jgi:hypothetical protein